MGLRGEQDARGHEFAVHQHRARAALASLAAVLHTPHARAPEGGHEQLVGSAGELFGLAVEGEVDVHGLCQWPISMFRP